jgi:hypothetical protein
MTLRDILQNMAVENGAIKLCLDNEVFEVNGLLETLPDPVLNRQAYLQPGLYIAEINESGYLGDVLLRFADNR